MKALVLSMLWLLPGGDREQGLQLYREGKFADAAAAFQRALQSEGDSPELQWNLALASWRAGDLATAETAVEKYAATSSDQRTGLHAGLLGAIRHQQALADVAAADAAGAAAPPPPTAAGQNEAPADPLPLLQKALQKATQARDHFVRGVKAGATPELRRNTERTLALIAELQRRIEELERQRQPQDPGEQKPDGDKNDKDDKNDKNEKNDKGEKSEQNENEQEPSEPKPSPDQQQQSGDDKQAQDKQQAGQKGEQADPQGKQGQSEPAAGAAGDEPAEPKPAAGEQAGPPGDPGSESKTPPPTPAPEPRRDAPGEQTSARELSPESTQRLLERLQELEGKQRAVRARAKSGRRPVERDW
jgi:hypothetical protein